MTQINSNWQFGLRHLFFGVLILSVPLAALQAGLIHEGQLMMWTSTVLVPMSAWFYFRLSQPVRRRARIAITVFSTLIGISPFLGAGGYAFIAPGATQPLPRLQFKWLTLLFMPLYLFGEFVLYFVDWVLGIALGPAYFRMIIFADEGPVRVRPFAVCVFWLGLAAVFGSWFLIEGMSNRRRRRMTRGEQPKAMA